MRPPCFLTNPPVTNTSWGKRPSGSFHYRRFELRTLAALVIDRSFDNRLTSSQPLQVSKCLPASKHQVLPISGTASDVEGIFSATKLRNTVNERRMVTPATKISDFILSISAFYFFTESMLQGVFL
jgi:hypothetical protein